MRTEGGAVGLSPFLPCLMFVGTVNFSTYLPLNTRDGI